jgi:FkbM family methyltransferase
VAERQVPPGVEHDLVYDVGMHRGDDTAFYLSRGYRVVGIEPNPQLVALLHNRFEEEERDGRVVILQVAIGDHSGSVTFTAPRDIAELGTTDTRFGDRIRRLGLDCELLEVEMTTLREVVRIHGTPYYLKVDIEGQDEAAVRTLAGLPVRPPLLSMESSVAGPKATVAGAWSEMRLLRRLGYRRFKLVNQRRLRELDGAVLDREGTPAVYSYSPGTVVSGPFGEEARGRWRGISVMPEMVGRLAQYHAFSEGGWFPSTRIGGSLRRGTISLQSQVAPQLHIGQRFGGCLGGTGWFDLHAAM